MAGDLGSTQTTNFSNLNVGGVDSNGASFGRLSLQSIPVPTRFSATSFNVVLHVVQGSASSFTVCATVPEVKKGDILIPNPFGGAGVSSISSGLVWTSHCTQDGQFEFRYSNVSTLVQNQSAQTFSLAIIRL